MRLFSGGLAGVCIGDDGQLSGAFSVEAWVPWSMIDACHSVNLGSGSSVPGQQSLLWVTFRVRSLSCFLGRRVVQQCLCGGVGGVGAATSSATVATGVDAGDDDDDDGAAATPLKLLQSVWRIWRWLWKARVGHRRHGSGRWLWERLAGGRRVGREGRGPGTGVSL